MLWAWVVSPECLLERVLNWIWTENHFELLFFHLRPHRKLLWWFCWSWARMSKHWLFWFRITEQDLTTSLGTFLHGNSLFLAGPDPHSFRHSSAFPSVLPECALWCCLALQIFAAGVHHSNFFTCLNWCYLLEKPANYLFLRLKCPVRLLRSFCVCSFQFKHLNTALSAA